jgi:hypothetical protein
VSYTGSIQLAIEIFTPSAASVRLRPAVVEVICITTPFWFFMAAIQQCEGFMHDLLPYCGHLFGLINRRVLPSRLDESSDD